MAIRANMQVWTFQGAPTSTYTFTINTDDDKQRPYKLVLSFDFGAGFYSKYASAPLKDFTSGNAKDKPTDGTDNLLIAYGGTVSVNARKGDDFVWVGDGTTKLNAKLGDGNDIGIGGALNDTISGDAGHDYLFGLGGNDSLLGGSGNDTINGGAGNDILIGGRGADIFIFSASDYSRSTKAFDTIRDFSTSDRIDLSSLVAAGNRFSIVDNNGIARIDIAFGKQTIGTITVQGMSYKDFSTNQLNYIATGNG